VDILLGPTPSGFVKGCIETIWTRSGITSHIFDDSVYLIKIRGRISKISEVWVRQGSGRIGSRREGVCKGSTSGLGNRRSENALKIGSKSGSNLIRGCGMGAVWVGEVRDSVFTVTLENGEVKEICIAITFNCPTFFLFECDTLPLYYAGSDIGGGAAAEGRDSVESDGAFDPQGFVPRWSGADL
jgi:hypothetical protein